MALVEYDFIRFFKLKHTRKARGNVSILTQGMFLYVLYMKYKFILFFLRLNSLKYDKRELSRFFLIKN